MLLKNVLSWLVPALASFAIRMFAMVHTIRPAILRKVIARSRNSLPDLHHRAPAGAEAATVSPPA
jgi:hypothetical protein